MSYTVAQQLVDTLTKAGVQRIYGIVGDSLNPVTDALRRSKKIQWVHVRHEETAAFAAGAEAQLTGRLAVLRRECGPGNLHLINGLFDAHRSLAPVLASPRTFPAPRSARATSRKRTRTSCSANAATIANSSPTQSKCRACCNRPCNMP